MAVFESAKLTEPVQSPVTEIEWTLLSIDGIGSEQSCAFFSMTAPLATRLRFFLSVKTRTRSSLIGSLEFESFRSDCNNLESNPSLSKKLSSPLDCFNGTGLVMAPYGFFERSI